VIAIWVLTVSRLASVLGVLECWWVDQRIGGSHAAGKAARNGSHDFAGEDRLRRGQRP
jgi:hypothetical protein